ncbi:hypothetical protein DNHGIG_00510 [Collibacillus ludicampi]|uniref:PD-(D/E)XK endonuclease-like domain-containing protein n=1 Tax=Collibacillus ludicampi TaxID=2771369 RepID=A0AAV4LAH7_9BACL|nr:hypothetical protein [Collibacillus ludicampi]GIM44502.1 hypothetical protein DNHGIG_00510 [Collibacillus ludicampi]
MSLTSMLNNNQTVIKLFSVIPNIKHLFKSLDGKEAFPKYIRPLVKPVPGYDWTVVGTAYDFWFRAYIQRLNGLFIEHELSSIIESGLLGLEGQIVPLVMTGKYEEKRIEEIELLKQEVNEIWKTRSDYINGENIPERELVRGSIILAYCEHYYRSGKIRDENYLHVKEEDVEDLLNIITYTEKIPHYFTTKKSIILNPIFKKYSREIGGADADFIIGNTIFDIKTSKYYDYKENEIWQLIGYYLLSEYDDDFPVEIKQIALFYARFNKIVYAKIEDIKQIFNLDLFSQYFRDLIAYKDEKDILKLDEQELSDRFRV